MEEVDVDLEDAVEVEERRRTRWGSKKSTRGGEGGGGGGGEKDEEYSQKHEEKEWRMRLSHGCVDPTLSSHQSTKPDARIT